jgi:CheY-like chemotaxis protein
MIDLLTRRGAVVVNATDRESALRAIERSTPDVILSDFTRNGDLDAGINDLEFFRMHDIYNGPVIFCSGQGTPPRQRRVNELRAQGPTNDENDIIRWLWQIASTRRPPTPQPG